jgi:subtilisin family serine protease
VSCNLSSDPFRFHHNPDPPTEFLARGIDVEVPWTGHGTITTTGNSFAAPHISGIAALVLAKHPDLRPFQLKTVLWATSANVREAGARGEVAPATPEMAGRITRALAASDLAEARRGARATMAARVPHR